MSDERPTEPDDSFFANGWSVASGWVEASGDTQVDVFAWYATDVGVAYEMAEAFGTDLLARLTPRQVKLYNAGKWVWPRNVYPKCRIRRIPAH